MHSKQTLNRLKFKLTPFEPPDPYNFNVYGIIAWRDERRDEMLCVDFNLSGEGIKIPSVSEHPRRRDNLWEHTCCELFIEDSGENHSQDDHFENHQGNPYMEWNFAFSGDWNLYRFDGYRRPSKQRPGNPEGLSVHAQGMASAYMLQVKFPIRTLKLHSNLKKCRIGISTVIEDISGKLHYYALTHPADRPDFHLHRSFSLSFSEHTPKNTKES